MTKKKSNKICIFDPNSDCKNCDLKDKLICKNLLKERILFTTPIFFALVFILINLWLHNFHTEFFIFLGIFIFFYVFFFCFFETKILCSHCPFYAEDSKILHCFANYGSPKIWKYKPRPMNNYEKIGLFFTFFCFLILFMYPIFIFYVNRLYYPIVIILSTFFLFFIFLTVFLCARCPNFFCPFNRVKDKVTKQFLEKNSIIKK